MIVKKKNVHKMLIFVVFFSTTPPKLDFSGCRAGGQETKIIQSITFFSPKPSNGSDLWWPSTVPATNIELEPPPVHGTMHVHPVQDIQGIFIFFKVPRFFVFY